MPSAPTPPNPSPLYTPQPLKSKAPKPYNPRNLGNKPKWKPLTPDPKPYNPPKTSEKKRPTRIRFVLGEVNEKPFEDLKHCTAALTRARGLGGFRRLLGVAFRV